VVQNVYTITQDYLMDVLHGESITVLSQKDHGGKTINTVW
jgi:hypothetical protein